MKQTLIILRNTLCLFVLFSPVLLAKNNPAIRNQEKSSKQISKTINILFLGDSLTHGYGVKSYEAFPVLVGEKLKSYLNKPIKIVNAGSSGATTASAKRRLVWQLKKTSTALPQFLVLALGANDGLRGLSLSDMEKNLRETIDYAIQRKIKVLLCGVRVPPSHGPHYSKNFAAVFHRLAKEKKLVLLPFLLKGVAAQDELNQADGLHPNAKGHKIIAELVFNSLKNMMGQK
jgi:acyl-CoA thioesterase I